MSLQDFQLYLAIAKDVFTIIASISAGVVAIVGLRTWRKQLKGKTEYELTQKLLIAIYRIRDSLNHVRNPMMLSGEISNALKEANIEGNANDSKELINTQAVYQQRWLKVQEAWSGFDVPLLEAEALWGKQITNLAKNLSNVTVDLRIHIQMHLDSLKYHKKFSADKIEKIEDVIYGFTGDEKDNKFSAEILEAIRKFEEFLKPKLIS